MRPLLVIVLYLTALSATSVCAGYFSLVLAGERGGGEPHSAEDSGDVDGRREYFARQAALFTWGMTGGALVFMATHLAGTLWLRRGLVNLPVEADPEDLLAGLWVHAGAAVLGSLIGGAVGWAFG